MMEKTPSTTSCPKNSRVRYVHETTRRVIGAKRNALCEMAQGDIIVHWDDDDWSAPQRLSLQVDALTSARADLCGLSRVLFLADDGRAAWEYIYSDNSGRWVYGATLCYRKEFWRRNRFPEIAVGEDARFVWADRHARIVAMPKNEFLVALVHAANTSPKRIKDGCWQPRPIDAIAAIMGPDWAAYGRARELSTQTGPKGAALVSAAFGIGDIIRVTPLVRVLRRLGYEVDLLIAPDYPAAVELFGRSPELRRVIHYPKIRENRGNRPLPELAQQRYALATFTTWSAPLARWVKSDRQYAFDQAEWLSLGDTRSIEKVARAVGWQGPLPEPFAAASGRAFDLPADTIALHPGCKPDWPWKKWHGFDGLARLLPHVAIIGTEADVDNSKTYFRMPFDWPAHAQNFVGKLGLADTAALISQCAALVANDSGLMHLGVALSVPTFGIFGITSPQREMIPSRWMIPVTKRLPCEEACRREAWGRRDCQHHLECLKMLTPNEVVAQIDARLPQRRQRPRTAAKPAAEVIRLNYYAGVFDASGYGQAARVYVRALHSSGVKVSVVDTGARPPQVDDALVASLVGNDPHADFHLFHGIPPYWAQAAFRLRNVIAMTVWETDTMPQQWRNPLSHAVDVWLPCSFNVDVFSRGLGRPAFCLPHAVPPRELNGVDHGLSDADQLHVAPRDFVFYSIFEWQDRKNARGMIEAFLRAFPEQSDAVLVLKTNPVSASSAQQTLDEVRATAGGRGRVVLCSEAWSEARIQALHDRGDCYVSLHKGEGWGYPLFEAAARGKAVIATDYAGPRDYLDPQRHWLVRNNSTLVRQRYQFYQPSMRWSEPDLAHASEGMRWTYEHREDARAAAVEAARLLNDKFSIERVGAMARARLVDLLRRTNSAKAASIQRQERDKHHPVRLPIPAEWFDTDYFENGVKSNWNQGYTWPLFKGVFEGAAAYLTEMFPEARTFLDIGCAKGFLVRALRERGLEAWGFDHSAWAIAHAEQAVKPFLQLADVAAASYDRKFDVLVAMSVFESLTEEQIRTFLPRARTWAEQALAAVIPTLNGSANRAVDDCDLSHITMRDRDWWCGRFLEAGWRQDAMHRVVERLCQSHPFPTKMGWSVYTFSPGN